MRPNEMNALALAYLGDAIYEIFVRKYLLEQGYVKVKELQAAAVPFVSAKGQAKMLKKLLDEDTLTEEEMTIVLRARNHKGTRHPKNTDILTYKHATALEALVGFWYLQKDFKRLEEIMNRILGEKICTYMEKM